MAKEKNNEKQDKKQDDVQKNKNIAALSYVFILFLVPLLLKRDSEFVQFHARQGLVLFIVELLAGMVSWFPVFGQLLMLLLLVVSIIAILKTLEGEKWEIPFIYEWSKKINL